MPHIVAKGRGIAQGNIGFAVTVNSFGEGDIATPLGEIQRRHPQVVIGSYPFESPTGYATNLVLRSRDEATLEQAYGDVCRMAQELTEQGKARGWS